MSHWFQPLPPEHPRTCPGIIPADGSCYLYLDYAELRHDSPQWDVRPREPSRQHESRLLIRVHPIRHDRARELGAFANPKGRPAARTPPPVLSPSYRNPPVARVPELDRRWPPSEPLPPGMPTVAGLPRGSPSDPWPFGNQGTERRTGPHR